LSLFFGVGAAAAAFGAVVAAADFPLGSPFGRMISAQLVDLDLRLAVACRCAASTPPQLCQMRYWRASPVSEPDESGEIMAPGGQTSGAHPFHQT